MQGTVAPGDLQQVVVTALAGAILLLAFRAAEFPRWAVGAAAALAAVILVLSIVRATAGGIGDGAARAMNATLLVFGPPAVAVGVLRELRASGQVRLDAVLGVLSLYMLLGLLFGFVYGALDRFGDEPFFAGGEAATVAHCLYFSFTTLTTVGYGDFVSQTDVGHTLAVFEALIGQIYLVTVVSLIVGNLGQAYVTGSACGRDSTGSPSLGQVGGPMRVTAEVSGAARISPTAPKRAPPAMVTIRTASGWMPSAVPYAIGCTICWRIPFASSWTTIIPAAASGPAPPSAITTANAPAPQAPRYGM